MVRLLTDVPPASEIPDVVDPFHFATPDQVNITLLPVASSTPTTCATIDTAQTLDPNDQAASAGMSDVIVAFVVRTPLVTVDAWQSPFHAKGLTPIVTAPLHSLFGARPMIIA